MFQIERDVFCAIASGSHNHDWTGLRLGTTVRSEDGHSASSYDVCKYLLKQTFSKSDDKVFNIAVLDI